MQYSYVNGRNMFQSDKKKYLSPLVQVSLLNCTNISIYRGESEILNKGAQKGEEAKRPIG